MTLDDDPTIRLTADHQAIDDAETTSAASALVAMRAELWATIHHLGFDGGKVLVQGDGADALLGRPGHTIPGVSSISATVGHPDQRFTDLDTFRGGWGAYDATVTVMPMADVELSTASAIVARAIVHASLAWASLRATKPGGLTAIITNHYTLDGNTPRMRVELETLADLIGAVRLPSGTLRPGIPGTDSVTDLLLFSRRADGQPSRSRDFIDTRHVQIDGKLLRVSAYFDQHPEHVLGQTGALHHPARPSVLAVTGRPNHMLAELHQTLGHIVETAHRDGITTPPPDYRSAMQLHAVHAEIKLPHSANPLLRPPPIVPRRTGPTNPGLSLN